MISNKTAKAIDTILNLWLNSIAVSVSLDQNANIQRDCAKISNFLLYFFS